MLYAIETIKNKVVILDTDTLELSERSFSQIKEMSREKKFG